MLGLPVGAGPAAMLVVIGETGAGVSGLGESSDLEGSTGFGTSTRIGAAEDGAGAGAGTAEGAAEGEAGGAADGAADGATDGATGATAEGAVAGGLALTPHCPMALLPGKAFMSPVTFSVMALGMLQDVDGSLRPPIRPGHLSIPAEPASQLSMICCKVGTSHPEMKSAWRL